MSNLLHVPTKRTYSLDIPQAVRAYLQERESRNPAQFRDDISQWHALRQGAIDPAVHVNRVDILLKYHAHLLAILSKLPVDIGLEVLYHTVFDTSAFPIAIPNLQYERASIAFNLASLYTQLATAEDRSQIQGIRRAIAFFQSAAGTYQYILDEILPKLTLLLEDGQSLPDLTNAFIKPLQLLCLAEAQECVWQVARLENRKNGILAKLAQSAANFYQSSYEQCMLPEIRHIFPPQFLAHIQAKGYHFSAVAQYRKSIDESERNSYGIEVARLTDACASIRKAQDISRPSKLSTLVVKDISSLDEMLRKELARAERDNDLIYLQEVPPKTMLPEIVPADLAVSVVPKGLSDPAALVTQPPFGSLVSWATREAINIYNDRKKKLVESQVYKAIQELHRHALSELQKRHLPASLDAIQKSVGLPSSILGKADEVRSDNGPTKVANMIEDIQRLSEQARETLSQAMDILDDEATEDEEFQDTLESPSNRISSQEANRALVSQGEKYREILNEASESDEELHNKWDEWSDKVELLIQNESDIEQTIPSSGYSPTSSSPETRVAAQGLRSSLEELDRLQEADNELVRRARSLCDTDNIEAKILSAASGLEKVATLRPELFEEMMDEELAKYDKFVKQVRANETKHQDILGKISALHERFIKSRKGDSSVKEREKALQSLDLAYHKYQEILDNLREGYQFYNDLSEMLSKFKDACSAFHHRRSEEITLLNQRMKATSLDTGSDTPKAVSTTVPSTSRVAPSSSNKKRNAVASSSFSGYDVQFAPPDSDSWEQMEIPPPPGPQRKKR